MPYKDPEKAKECKRKSRLKFPEKYKEYARKSKENNKEQRLWKSAKGNAKTMSREFNIDVSDIIVPTHCPYLGIKLTSIVGDGKKNTNISLDRKDNTKDYIKGNVQVISWKANKLKNDLTEEELVIFANNILKLHAHTV